MSVLNKIFLILLLLFIIIVAGILYLVAYIDPNKLKPTIREEFHRQTGKELEIIGPLNWALYPRFSLHADQMNIKEDHDKPAFLILQNVKIATDFKQLFKKTQTLQAKVYIDQTTYEKLHIQDLQVNIIWNNPTLSLQKINGVFYEGKLTGNAEGMMGSMPKWQWQIEVSGLQLHNLIKDMHGGDSKLMLQGKTDLELKLQTTGQSKTEMIQNIQGTGALQVNKGILQGIDLNYYIEGAEAFVKKGTQELTNTQQTFFERLQSNFDIGQGLLTINQLTLIAPAFHADAKGSISLLNSDLNLEIHVIPEQLQWNIPLAIMGNIEQPKIYLQLNQLDQMLPKKDREALKAKAIETIKAKIPGKTGDFLQRILSE